MANPVSANPVNHEITPLQRLCTQLLQRWRHFPDEQRAALEQELEVALERAKNADAEMMTVMNPVSRPLRLRLAVLVSDAALDTFYQQEQAELAVSHQGRCYLVYRRRDGGSYAIEWSPATTIPATMAGQLSDALAMAMLEGDDSGDNDDEL